MKVYGRYACHRVYDTFGHCHPQAVVAIDTDGKVIGCTPLTHETPFTEWIGGVIVLSPMYEKGSWTDFRSIRCGTAPNGQLPLYAWHISHFDFAKEELTVQSLIRRLPFSV